MKAFEEGIKAKQGGKQITDNPYSYLSSNKHDFIEWLAGYCFVAKFKSQQVASMRIFKKFPAPWSIVDELGGKAYSVLDANDVPIYYSGTYSGDGDEEILLTKEDWAEIVKIMNREGQA